MVDIYLAASQLGKYPPLSPTMNSAWLITSELADQRARKALFTCVVYTKSGYSYTALRQIVKAPLEP